MSLKVLLTTEMMLGLQHFIFYIVTAQSQGVSRLFQVHMENASLQ